jgi:hypothetical protein
MHKTFSTLILLFTSLYAYSQVYGEELISFDFSNGIPENWERSSESGIGLWEYRGPLTIPDNTVASRGSCGAQSEPVESTTHENGFVIFDSNYWDDETGPCGNIGSGIDPGPHSADLTSSPLDFTGETSLVLTFQQQYKNFQGATSVSISIDGGNSFEPIIENNTQVGFFSGDLNLASVNISAIAANQPDVRIRFHFEGLYYYWMIDDIVIYKPNNNDIFMPEARYTAFNFNQGFSGIEKMEYSIYPRTMITPFQFHADALNIGNNTQTSVTLTAKVFNQSEEELAVLSSSPISIPPGEFSTLATEEYLPSETLGSYSIEFQIDQAEEDEDEENNFASKSYKMSEYTFARDKYEMDGEFTPADEFAESHFELGNYFEGIITEPLKCTSISVAFSENSSVGATTNGLILNLLRDSVMAETLPYEINQWDLNQVGEAKFVTLELIEPYLITDTIFLASFSSFQENGLVRIATSGISPASTTIIEYPSENATFYTLTTPMIRVNIFPLSSLPGCTNSSAFNYDPLADIDDGSCRIAGCTNELYPNFEPLANFDDGSCEIIGCDDPEADNYSPDAEIIDNTTCLYSGCINAEALNFNEQANLDDGSCIYNDAVLFVNEEFGCAPFSIEITNQTLLNEGAECSFNLGEGTILEVCELDAYTHTYDSPGVYTITYSYTVDDFISTAEITITVYEAEPAPLLDYLDDVNQITCTNCLNENSYNWILDNVIILEDAPFDLLNPENGTYILELDNGSNCTAQSNTLVVAVQEIGCNDPDADNYNPDADIIDNDTCLYSGCTDEEAINFDEQANLDDGSCAYNAAVLFVNEEFGCAPFSIEITNQTLLTEGAECSYNLGEGTILEVCELDAYTHTYDSPGTYTITYTYTVGEFISTDEITITVYEDEPDPILDYLSETNQITCTNCVSENSYNWILDDAIFLEDADFDLLNPQNGTYILELDNGSNCTAQSAPLQVTSIEEDILELEISIYPNPAREFIQISSPFSSFDFQIIDSSGKVVATGLLSSPGIHRIDFRKFSSGVYLLKSANKTYKIIKT